MQRGFLGGSDHRKLAVLAIGAITLRLLLFLGRGDYIAFDEGWYLLLGRSFWDGEGYRLTGLRHFTLSPLFPILAGGMARLVGDPVWGGRIVAAITSGLLVLPCWSIFKRLSGRRVAFLAAVLIAVIPSLAPFVAPELVGWDLWVGAEPVFHLFLYTGLALVLRAWESRRLLDWGLAGVAFSLAYLARSEAVVIAGLAGVVAVGLLLIRREPKSLLGPVVLGAAFAVVSFPYWNYLHDVTGRWSLTGRSVQVARRSDDSKPRAAEIIEGMLWQGRPNTYTRTLFGLHPSGTRMASTYWGVPEDEGGSIPERVAVKASHTESSDSLRAPGAGTGGVEHSGTTSSLDSVSSIASPGEGDAAGTVDQVSGGRAQGVEAGESVQDATGKEAKPPAPISRVKLYFMALGKVIPVWLAPLIVFGLLVRRSRPGVAELLVIVPLLAASILIARIVAIDPRTQLVLVPLAIYYAARGGRALGVLFDSHGPRGVLQRGFVGWLLAVVVVGWLLTEDLRRLYLGVTAETSRQIKAAADREVGVALRRIVPEDATIMSWHPALALHSRREWRVQPIGELPELIRYAHAVGAEFMVISLAHPGPIPVEMMPRNYLVLELPKVLPEARSWTLRLEEFHEEYAVGKAIPQ